MLRVFIRCEWNQNNRRKQQQPPLQRGTRANKIQNAMVFLLSVRASSTRGCEARSKHPILWYRRASYIRMIYAHVITITIGWKSCVVCVRDAFTSRKFNDCYTCDKCINSYFNSIYKPIALYCCFVFFDFCFFFFPSALYYHWDFHRDRGWCTCVRWSPLFYIRCALAICVFPSHISLNYHVCMQWRHMLCIWLRCQPHHTLTACNWKWMQ